MTSHDPLHDLGAQACPRCLEPMDPAGTVIERATDNGGIVEGAPWWECPRCGLVALV